MRAVDLGRTDGYREAAPARGRPRQRLVAALLMLAAGAVQADGLSADPMRPPATRQDRTAPDPADRIAQLALTSTVVAPDRRVAVVSGRRLRVGDRIAGAQVVAIEPASVRLVADGRTYTLRLLPTNIKRPAKRADVR